MAFGQKYEVSQAHHVVSNKDEFLKVLKEVKKNEIIYIKDDAEIDLTSYKRVQLPSHVTFTSGRGINGSEGGLIFTNAPASPLFICGDNVSFSNLRIKGPDTEKYHQGKIHTGPDATRLNMYKNPVSKGIFTTKSNLKIENCELFGWTHSAVVVSKGAKNAIVRNSHIHHNMRYGLGYGVTVDGGFVHIENNVFDYNRHDIAGTGIAGSGYEATNNVFLENTYSHSVDMHGGKDRKDNTNIAGTLIKVHNNTFKRIGNSRAILIRGIPQEGAYLFNNTIEIINDKNVSTLISDNKNLSISKYIQQINAKGNLEVYDNTIK